MGAANVGGPVIDTDGEVVGIAVTAQNGERPPGFAVDVVRERSVIDALERGTTLTNALGAEAIDVTPLSRTITACPSSPAPSSRRSSPDRRPRSAG